ncbi:MAG: ATP-dependent helicase, partial [Lentisphaeria bacterium]|nr:ATP-dependent helicase [Lentisphaeria bacterium]
MKNFGSSLPVEAVLGDLEEALTLHNCAVLCAEPGAGKSTLVPPALMESDFLQGQKILMLEPRRIAARGAARR